MVKEMLLKEDQQRKWGIELNFHSLQTANFHCHCHFVVIASSYLSIHPELHRYDCVLISLIY